MCSLEGLWLPERGGPPPRLLKGQLGLLSTTSGSDCDSFLPSALRPWSGRAAAATCSCPESSGGPQPVSTLRVHSSRHTVSQADGRHQCGLLRATSSSSYGFFSCLSPWSSRHAIATHTRLELSGWPTAVPAWRWCSLRHPQRVGLMAGTAVMLQGPRTCCLRGVAVGSSARLGGSLCEDVRARLREWQKKLDGRRMKGRGRGGPRRAWSPDLPRNLGGLLQDLP